jgi:hypothetical protein
MSEKYHCPNCRASLEASALACPSCGASFEAGAAWRPQTPTQAASPGRTSPVLTAFGIAALCATVFPLGSRLLTATVGGMYGPVFKPYSPALFLAVSYLVNYVPLAVVVWLLLRRFHVLERVPSRYRGGRLFTIGVTLLVLYLAARVFAATVPGGGAGFMVASFSPFVVMPALILLAVGAVRLTYGLGRGAV